MPSAQHQTAAILPFTRFPIRAIVIVPADNPHIDICRAVSGGFPIDGPAIDLQGTLQTVLWHFRADPRGLPITIHPECERRAAA